MARTRKWLISLSAEELKFAKHEKNKASSETLKKRYGVLIAANKYPSSSYKEIGYKAGVTEPTVISSLKAFCTMGFEGLSAVSRSPKSDVSRLKVDGEIEARLIAKACQAPPEGAIRWTISLLQEEMSIILQNDSSIDINSVSRSAVGRAMLRNELRPHLNEYWCIPPEEDANFVAAMEDILDVYKLPYDPDYPVWCMDEKPYQLLDDSRKPLPMRPGDIAKVDSEYVRHGTVSIFCFIQPHTCFLQDLFGESCRTFLEVIAAPFWRLLQRIHRGRGHFQNSKFPSQKLFSVSSPQRPCEGIPALSR